MIISFFGHRHFYGTEAQQKLLFSLLEKHIRGADVSFYLGNYGGFDQFAFKVAKQYQKIYKNAETVFVTPYIGEDYGKLGAAREMYDSIVYPPIEGTPYRYAISKRNAWMVEVADLSIFYVRKNFGGAYSALCHAKKRKKTYLLL